MFNEINNQIQHFLDTPFVFESCHLIKMNPELTSSIAIKTANEYKKQLKGKIIHRKIDQISWKILLMERLDDRKILRRYIDDIDRSERCDSKRNCTTINFLDLMNTIQMLSTKNIEEEPENIIDLCENVLTAIQDLELPFLKAELLLLKARGQAETGNFGKAASENLIKSLDPLKRILLHTQKDLALAWILMQQGILIMEYAVIEYIGKGKKCINEALKFYDKNEYKYEWALCKINTCLSIYKKPGSNFSEKIELSLKNLAEVKSIIKPQEFPHLWGQACYLLGVSYFRRIKDDWTGNLEKARKLFSILLTVYTRELNQFFWAKVHFQLGTVFQEYITRYTGSNEKRYTGRRLQDLTQNALYHFQRAAEVFTKECVPSAWARIQNSIAVILFYSFSGEKEENLNNAISLLQDAIEILSMEKEPEFLASCYHNLTTALIEKKTGDRKKTLMTVVDFLEKALEIRKKDKFFQEWAKSRMNLAKAFAELAVIENPNLLNKAFKLLKENLNCCNPVMFPNIFKNSAQLLGTIYAENQNWLNAGHYFRQALKAVEIIRSQTVTMEAREAELEETASIYYLYSFVLGKIGRVQDALKILERGKTVELRKYLALDSSLYHKAVKKNHKKKYEFFLNLMRAIDVKKSSIVDKNSIITSSIEKAESIQKQINILTKQIRKYVPEFLHEKDINLKSVSTILENNNTLCIAFNVTSIGTACYIFWKKQEDNSVANDSIFIDSFDNDLLFDLSAKWAKNLEILKSGWLEQDDILTWSREAEDILLTLYDKLYYSLFLWINKYMGEFKVLLLVPHLSLNIFPYNMLKNPESNRYLIEDFEVKVIPSINIFKKVKNNKRKPTQKLLGIANPGGDLPASEKELEIISNLYQGRVVNLIGREAGIERLIRESKNSEIIHFACHSRFDFENPHDSHLILCGQNGECTTFYLKKIYHDLKLPATRLVVLSSCESGMVKYLNRADEFTSLPAGFLRAGASTVIYTLWSVEDLTTSRLMEEFYRNYLNDKMTPSAALRKAQLKIMNESAFENPYFWSAFVVTSI